MAYSVCLALGALSRMSRRTQSWVLSWKGGRWRPIDLDQRANERITQKFSCEMKQSNVRHTPSAGTFGSLFS